jgi:parallel beta-helix repeat protein
VGILLGFTDNSNVFNNRISNATTGISIYSSYENNIFNNTIREILEHDIYLDSSCDNEIFNNTMRNGTYGAYLIYSSNSNLFSNNSITENTFGFKVYYSNYNNITYNNIVNNENGIDFFSSEYNWIYRNNFINNPIQAIDDIFIQVNHWDRGYPIGGNFWSDYNGFDNFSGPDKDIPGSDGFGELNYSINSKNWDNYPLMTPAGDCIFLYKGWNLISIPFVQLDTALSEVLYPIDAYYKAVQFHDSSVVNGSWKHHNIEKTFGNDHLEINETMGLWISIHEPDGVLFEYKGIRSFQNTSIQINEGWNHVGFPSGTRKNRTEALNNLTFGLEIDAIWTYYTNLDYWDRIEENDSLEPGRGYFIHSKVETTWEVPL